MDKFNFDQVIKKLEQAKSSLPKVLANDTKKFFLASWQKQGWDDNGIAKWAPRKKNKNKRAAGRAILVKSGALRRAVNGSLRSATFNSIKFSVDLPYAQIHNEGGAINKGSRRMASLNFKIGKDGKSRFAKYKNSNFQKRNIYIGAHSVNMPKRQFMGDSASSRKIQKETIQKSTDKIFK